MTICNISSVVQYSTIIAVFHSSEWHTLQVSLKIMSGMVPNFGMEEMVPR